MNTREMVQDRWTHQSYFTNVVYSGSNSAMEATPTTTATTTAQCNDSLLLKNSNNSSTNSTVFYHSLFTDNIQTATSSSATTNNSTIGNKRGCKELQPVKRRRLSERSELKIIPVLVPKKESQGCWKTSPTSPTVYFSQKLQIL